MKNASSDTKVEPIESIFKGNHLERVLINLERNRRRRKGRPRKQSFIEKLLDMDGTALPSDHTLYFAEKQRDSAIAEVDKGRKLPTLLKYDLDTLR